MFARPTIPARTAGAVVLLAVGFWASSGTAAASCGDYVRIAGQPGAHGSAPADPAPAPGRPAHGPGCSADPAPAPAPLTAPPKVEPGSKDLAARTPADAPTPSASNRLAFLDADGRPISRPSSTFHPLRPV